MATYEKQYNYLELDDLIYELTKARGIYESNEEQGFVGGVLFFMFGLLCAEIATPIAFVWCL